jgi:hypothetical protein
MKPKPPWENESGVQVLRLYKTDQHPDWPKDVNKEDLHHDWPRIVVLDLTAEQFKEFDQDPLAFANKYNLYPEQPLLALSHCARPPHVKGNPGPPVAANWMVVVVHPSPSMGVCAAAPQNTTG